MIAVAYPAKKSMTAIRQPLSGSGCSIDFKLEFISSK